MGSKGSKDQRQNQHARRLASKIRRFKAKGKNTEGLEKELDYVTGGTPRPEFRTGREVDPRLRKGHKYSHLS